MAKQIFKHMNVNLLTKAQLIDSPHIIKASHKKELEVEDDEVKGKEEKEDTRPSLEEIELAFEEKKEAFRQEMEQKRQEAMEEAERIKKDAETWAFDKVKEASEEYERRIADAEAQAQGIQQDAQANIEAIQRDAEEKALTQEQDAFNRGYEEGREDGFNSGKDEVDRLIERLNIILQSALAKRDEVIEEAEAQVIDIIMAICRKVVKTITDTQKNIVVENIHKALENIRQRSEITIKVNTEDLQMTTKHKREFVAAIEDKMKSEGREVKILEDNTIERGGCIIETDFGSIDARIKSQLGEIESRIKEISPYQEKF